MMGWIKDHIFKIALVVLITSLTLAWILYMVKVTTPPPDSYLARYICWNCGGTLEVGGLFSPTTVVPRRCWVKRGTTLDRCCNCGVELHHSRQPATEQRPERGSYSSKAGYPFLNRA